MHLWTEEGSTAVAVERTLAAVPSLRWLLIAALDSERDLTRVPRLADATFGVTFLDRQAALPANALAGLSAAAPLLTGFDEVWLLAGRPFKPRPDGFTLTTDAEDPGDLSAMEAWMRRAGVRVGFGDGVGLRAVVLDPADRDAVTAALRAD